MSPNALSLAERVLAETGLEFAGKEGRDGNGNRWVELQPADHPAGQTFSLRTIVGWRRIDVLFRPGNFASELIEAMRSSGEEGRRIFRSVLGVCRDQGAEVVLTINGVNCDPDDPSVWDSPWRSVELAIRRGMLPINEGNVAEDLRLIETWTSRVAVAIIAILPLEAEGEETTPETRGLPEGAKTRIEVNRYERDGRNRAAALAIHGYTCKACGLELSERYGSAAAGLIEVHHVTPVSQLAEGYVVDPVTDLVPLCPNCHCVAHRRIPPYSVEELRQMLQLKVASRASNVEPL